jgi:ABC-type branched-subunit amino acid transport system ATPase component
VSAEPGQPNPAEVADLAQLLLAGNNAGATHQQPVVVADDDAGGEPLLDVQALDAAYGRVQVLFGVDVVVHRGETVALLGTNGAGKSTLLRVISGLQRCTGGTVRFDGCDITTARPDERVKRGIVQMVGGSATFGPLSVLENLRVAGHLLGRRERAERAARVLDRFPILAERRSAPAGELSGGQQQMLALSMALMHDPELLVIDELSLGLAPVVVEQMLAVIRELEEEGRTMLLVEQSLNVALAVARRAVFLEKGTVRFRGPTRQLVDQEDLVHAMFLGRP